MCPYFPACPTAGARLLAPFVHMQIDGLTNTLGPLHTSAFEGKKNKTTR